MEQGTRWLKVEGTAKFLASDIEGSVNTFTVTYEDVALAKLADEESGKSTPVPVVLKVDYSGL